MNQWLLFRKAAAALLLCAATAWAGPHPTFTILTTFPTGVFPVAPPVQGIDGNFYGITAGVSPAPGTIYKVTPQGALTTIYTFCSQPNCSDGSEPEAGLVLGTDGNFYGTTVTGGTNNLGTVFRVTPVGALTTLYSFDQTDGSGPCAPLIQGNSGDFYSTTFDGGTSGYGTIFKITPAGKLTTLYDFTGADNALVCASLLQAANGSFYGTTANDGGFGRGNGTIYELTLAGAFSTVLTFNGSDGANPQDGLVQTADGNFYGTTAEGGACSEGTVFELAPDGTLTTLFSFSFGGSSSIDGSYPYAPLVYASNGKLVGTASFGGGPGHAGTVFEISTKGALNRLHSFSASEGEPYRGLIQGADGAFFGVSQAGILYKLSTGAPPFIKTVPLSGPPASAVTILGTNLTGTTAVTFNGVPAAFTLDSATEITATVPAGAATGKVQVTTPVVMLSNVGQFIVTP